VVSVEDDQNIAGLVVGFDDFGDFGDVVDRIAVAVETFVVDIVQIVELDL
jgi:hypothetical protein